MLMRIGWHGEVKKLIHVFACFQPMVEQVQLIPLQMLTELHRKLPPVVADSREHRKFVGVRNA